MRRIFVFNGDADGLCALQQLRLAEGDEPADFITGPKRRTELVKEVCVEDARNLTVTVLDLSFRANAAAITQLLEAGAWIRYFDHHHAGEVPSHAALEVHIDVSPDVCTSVIVDRHLASQHSRWAVVGAFGDNLDRIARALAAHARIPIEHLTDLQRLGIALNYNSYAGSEADMFFPPLELYKRISPYADPSGFVREDPAFGVLWNGYREDMQHVAGLRAFAANDHAAVYVLPDAAWARRITGVFANSLTHQAPRRAHAVVADNGNGGLAVSVRAPLAKPFGAAALCVRYPTGGGRESAAGINHLPAEEFEAFAQRFIEHFGA